MKKWLALVILTGCSSVQWDKPGVTQAAVDADLRACTSAAEAVPTLSSPRTTSSGIEMQPHPTDRDADRQLQQAQRVQTCMRDRGYSLKGG